MSVPLTFHRRSSSVSIGRTLVTASACGHVDLWLIRRLLPEPKVPFRSPRHAPYASPFLTESLSVFQSSVAAAESLLLENGGHGAKVDGKSFKLD